jgi:hypothetical protein
MMNLHLMLISCFAFTGFSRNNPLCRLGFTMLDGTVLDKRRLRLLFGTVFGVFATVVPVILAMSNDASGTVHYGSLPGSPWIYAWNGNARDYEESNEFCEGLWMRMASVHSQEEHDAIIKLTGGLPSDLGATRMDGKWRWDDGALALRQMGK